MPKKRKAPPVRIDFGGGRMAERDLPPPKVWLAIVRLHAAWSGRIAHDKTEQDRDVRTYLNWIDQQNRKHGEWKPAGEEPAEVTLSLSREEKELIRRLIDEHNDVK